MTLFDVWPMRPEQPAMVGIAFTMRFIPSREDKDGPTSTNRSMVQPQAMEECPPGHVLMIDSRGDSRAASAGDLYVGRLKARGAAGPRPPSGLRPTNRAVEARSPASPPPAASRPAHDHEAGRGARGPMTRSGSAQPRPDLQPALQGQRDGRAFGDLGHALLLLVVDGALDGEHAVDVLLVALAHEVDVGMHRR